MIKPIFKSVNRILLLFALTFSIGGSHAQVSTDAAAAYGLRKLNPGYSGNAIQVRRSCDNLTANIGFTACGDLDTLALKAHVFGAPPLGSGSGTAMSYALRKLLCGYSGSLIRVRRSCDNAETDIGFSANGDLDTVALKNFVFSAGPLNMITPVSSVAYSLRRLRCAYSGPAIRVRRSSDNAEADVAFDANSAISGSSVCTVTAVGSSALSLGATLSFSSFYASTSCFVTTWYDQSGNGKNATQSTASNQPRIVNAGTMDMHNGKPALNFNGSNQFLVESTQSFSNPYTMHVVASRSAAGGCCGGYQRIINISSSGDQYGYVGTLAGDVATFCGNGSTWNDITANSPATGIGTGSVANIITALFSSGVSGLTAYVNGTAQTSKNGTASAATGFTIGGVYAGSNTNQIWNGYISECIAFSSSLNNTDRQKLEYLQSVYYSIAGPATVSISSTSADAYVTTWYDQSGSSRNATQTTVANQPRIMNDGAIDRNNGKPTIVFDGVNDYFTHNNFPTSGFTGFTANMLARWTTTGSSISTIQALMDNDHRCGGPSSGVGFIVQDRPDLTNRPVTFASPNGSACNSLLDNVTTGNGTFRLLSFVNNGTSENIYRDGSLTATQAYSGAYIPQSRFVIGAWWNLGSVSRFLNGSMSEITIFPLGLNNADRKNLEYNQAVYYNISGPTSATSTNGPSGYVTTWYDQSGNGNHITQATSSRQPVIIQAGKLITINGRPAMRSSSVLQTNLTSNLASTYTGTGLLANAVYQTDTTTSSNLRIMSTGNGALLDWNENGLFNINHRGGATPTLVIERNAVSPSIGITTGIGGIVTASFSGTQREITGNGTSGGTVGDTRAFNFNKLRLFQSFNNATFEPIESFTGRLSEYVLYTKAISNTRRTILENNQAEYYGITISNDKFPPVDQTYNRTINGIGFQSSSDSVQRTRVSRGFIIQDDASSASNFLRDAGDYIMSGVNCNITPATTAANLSQNVVQRWTTDWEVKRTDVNNNGGSVKFIFDFSDYWQSGMLPGSAASNYVLLKRSASNGTFDTLAVTSKQVSGDQVIFTFNASNINTFFTLGTVNSTLAPLPMELMDFRCSKVAANRIDLSWTTASETNNDHFTVERSADGKNFKGIGIVKGAGNSSEPKNYSLADYSPIMGTAFYRVKQTDYNGTVHYSNLCAVNNFNGNADGVVKIYPNPASASLTVELGTAGANRISLINSLGEEVYSTSVSDEQSTITLDCSKLVSGIYLVQIHNADAGIINRKVIIQN